MLRILKTLSSVFKKPLFGTTVIPHDATVDPAQFPEDEYPAHCTKCQYCLNGLPDGKCPECGTDFVRGALLVKLYGSIVNDVRWRYPTAYKWYWRLIVVGSILPIAGFLSMMCLAYYIKINPLNMLSQATATGLTRLVYANFIVMCIGPLLTASAVIIAIMTFSRGCRKRRRAIIDAIKQPETKRA